MQGIKLASRPAGNLINIPGAFGDQQQDPGTATLEEGIKALRGPVDGKSNIGRVFDNLVQCGKNPVSQVVRRGR